MHSVFCEKIIFVYALNLSCFINLVLFKNISRGKYLSNTHYMHFLYVKQFYLYIYIYIYIYIYTVELLKTGLVGNSTIPDFRSFRILGVYLKKYKSKSAKCQRLGIFSSFNSRE